MADEGPVDRGVQQRRKVPEGPRVAAVGRRRKGVHRRDVPLPQRLELPQHGRLGRDADVRLVLHRAAACCVLPCCALPDREHVMTSRPAPSFPFSDALATRQGLGLPMPSIPCSRVSAPHAPLSATGQRRTCSAEGSPATRRSTHCFSDATPLYAALIVVCRASWNVSTTASPVQNVAECRCTHDVDDGCTEESSACCVTPVKQSARCAIESTNGGGGGASAGGDAAADDRDWLACRQPLNVMSIGSSFTLHTRARVCGDRRHAANRTRARFGLDLRRRLPMACQSATRTASQAAGRPGAGQPATRPPLARRGRPWNAREPPSEPSHRDRPH